MLSYDVLNRLRYAMERQLESTASVALSLLKEGLSQGGMLGAAERDLEALIAVRGQMVQDREHIRFVY